MNNAAGTLPVPLTVFGGAVTEMAPEDLPEGASPFNQDVDFVPGATFTRGGRQSVYAFSGLFAEDLAGFAVSIPGLFNPAEVAWSNPSNATLGLPGTYAQAILNSSGGAAPGLDQVFTNTAPGSPTTISYGPFTPRAANEIVIASFVTNSISSIAPNGTIVAGLMWSSTLTVNPTTYTATLGSSTPSAVVAASFFSTGALGIVQHNAGSSLSLGFASTVPSTDAIVVALGLGTITSPGTFKVTDDQGNVYTQLGLTSVVNGGNFSQCGLWILQSPTNAPRIITITQLSGGTIFASEMGIADVTGLATPTSADHSQILQASNFGFNIPSGEAILGAELEVFGHQGSQPADATLQAVLVEANGTVSPTNFTFQLPLSDGEVVLGTPGTSWGLQLTPAILNSPSFLVQIVASATAGELQVFDIYGIKLKIFTTPSPPANFNWIKTYEQTSGQLDTLALDANGVLWDENVTANPGVLNGIYTGILPGTYAKSVTFDDVEYIALSSLVAGTDIPRRWNGSTLERVSQVGPGAPPSVNASSTIFGIAPSPNGITQPPAVVPLHGFSQPNGFGAILWSAGPGSTQTGSTITFYYSLTSQLLTPDPNIIVGHGIYIQGCPLVNGQSVNGTFIVTSTGSAVPPNGNFANPLWYFTVTATTTNSGFFFTPNSGIVGSSYQVTLATLTTLTPLPNTQVGSQIQLAGVGVAAWDATWTILATLNAAQLSITQTQLQNNVATYTYSLITGTAPTIGQQVTIVGCLNGPIVGGTSIFNISNGIISSVGANQFSINITANNVLPAAESGNATVNGTKFQFDPGIQLAGSMTVPIFGNSGGGTVVVGGAGLGAGVRKAVLMFLTDNGLITAPSPPVIFETTGNSTSLAFSNILIGPPNTIARIIGLTGANGGNFFYTTQPTIIQTGGQNLTYTSTMISDNVSTTALLTFTDAVLLSGVAMDITGNNLFNQIELGSCRGFLTYASRLFAWGEQNKIQNLLNLSFDGGVGVTASANTTYPAGWTVDPTNGAGGNLRVSPIFGNSYYILNTSGSTLTLYGTIEQGAYQDAYQAPIVQPNLAYSVRLTARCPSGVVSGNLVVDFYSPLQNRIFGSFTVPLSSMTTNFQIFSGVLLATPFTSVPPDLIFRVYATNLPNNGDIELDRVEPYPSLQPVFSTQLRGSYVNNQEAFDLVTGACGPNQNQQPINGAFTLFDLLYVLKEKSLYSTSDTGVSEPNKWTFKEVSQKVGTCGPLSYDLGEGWMITACRPGVYFFEGGEPIKISQEIQPVWDLINWQNPAVAASIWIRNDEQTKRVTIGVPIPTPNPYMPEFPVNANPTSPNVILMCSYRELNTGAVFAQTGPIRSTFSGRLMSPEPARKWSFWNIACPYADFVSRGGEQWTEFFCNGYQNSKIYQLSSAELDDDGAPINSFYVTYGFTKPEMADAKGLGLFRMELDYLTMLVIGNGQVKTQVYPESVQNPLPYQLGSDALQLFSNGDNEVAVNITGNRFFIRVGTNAVGSSFRLSKVVAALVKDPWAEVRGTAVGSA